MRLATFTESGKTRLGVVVDDEIADLQSAAPELPRDMRSFLEAGPEALERAEEVAKDAPRLPLAGVRLQAPVPNPGKILAIGLNYADHVEESGMERPQYQIWFNKQWNAVSGPTDDILLPAVAPDMVDYEGELCLVIGRRCRHVPRERATEVIAGYTCGNDVSVRDWQIRTPQFTLGKSFETHAPIGPWIVTADEFGDPHDKTLSTTVNAEERQSSNTRHLIFDCFDQIAELSSAFTLYPGDILFTGTPGGVGAAMDPRRFLRPGDSVRVEIEGIGAIENVCREERRETLIA